MKMITPPLKMRKIHHKITYPDRLCLSSDHIIYSQFYNVISLYTDLVERFFIDVAKEILLNMDDDYLIKQLKIFLKQEARHSTIHDRYNAMLGAKYPQVNDKIAAGWRRFEDIWQLNGNDLQYKLYLVAMSEIYTERLAEFFFEYFAHDFMRINPSIAYLFGYHWAEEIEHKSLMFDIYHYLYGHFPQQYKLHHTLWPELQSVTIERCCVGVSYLSTLDRLIYKTPFVSQQAAENILCSADGVFPHANICSGLDDPTFHPWQNNNRRWVELWDQELSEQLIARM